MTNQATKPNPDDDSAEKPLISKVGMAVLIELLAGAVLGVLGLNFETEQQTPEDPSTPYGPVGDPSGFGTEDDPDVSIPEDAPEEPVSESEEPPTDPLAAVGIGDCLYNLGTADDLEMEPTDCGPGVFEVVDLFDDAEGLSACDGVTGSLYGYDNGFGWVYCLSYLHPWGDAYYAAEGYCFTTMSDGTYQVTECAAGTVQVMERLWGDRSSDACAEQEYYDGSVVFDGYAAGQDVKLCTRIRYPDDIGYAPVDTCLYASGPEDDMTFEFADCDWANVYVTGRSSAYDDIGMCDGYWWATWQSGAFPEYAYTVCFAWF